MKFWKSRRSPARDPGYLDFLRNECKCIVCVRAKSEGWRVEADAWLLRVIDPAHGPVNGTSSKGPDREAVPLCRFHHDEQHRRGWTSFQQLYSFNRIKEARVHFKAYKLWRQVTNVVED